MFFKGLARTLGAVIVVAAISTALIVAVVTGVFPPRPAYCNSSSAAIITILSGSTVNVNASITYNPKVANIVLGVNDTVIWKNADSNAHTVSSVSSDPQQFESGEILPGGTFCHHFSQIGTYNYYCRFHSWMQATVIVKQ